MTATLYSTATPVPGPLPPVHDIDGVIDNLNHIIRWSVGQRNAIGYFAVLYKRSTLAIREALRSGLFEDSARMERFDAVFAQRYFDALNAYFHPHVFGPPALAWEVSFAAHDNSPTTMLQQMLAGLNAHICYDLGVAAAEVSPTSLQELKNDFDRITDVVLTQVDGMALVFERLSPGYRWVRTLTPERWLFRHTLNNFRNGAWLFAIGLAMNPQRAPAIKTNQMSWTAALGAWYLNPPGGRKTPLPLLIDVLGKGESVNVGGNLRALDRIASRPADVRPAFAVVSRTTRRA